MSKELAKTYDPKGIEERLYQKWVDGGYFHAKVRSGVRNHSPSLCRRRTLPASCIWAMPWTIPCRIS